MKTFLAIALLATSLPLAALAADAAAQKPGACVFAKPERMQTHATAHIKYPSSGVAIKASCKKEWPDEFSKAEWACFDASVQDERQYKSADELLAAVGAKAP